MSRLDTLEARRRALLNKCEEQRLELAYRVAQITPKAALTAWSRRAGGKAGKSPLPWVAGAVSLLLMFLRRRRKSKSAVGGVGGVGLITGVLALASRATTILRVLAQLRGFYLTYKATRRPTDR